MQLRLHVRQELRIFSGFGFLRLLVANLIKGRGDNFLLALGDLVIVLLLPAAATAALLLRLRIFLFERLRFNESHVGLSGAERILCRGIDADQIARHQLEVFQRDHSFARRFLDAFLVEQGNYLFLASIHGVVEIHAVQAEIVFRFDGQGHLFQRVDLRVTAGADNLHHRRRLLLSFDKEVLGQPDVFPFFNGGDVVHSVLLDRHFRM